jgi:hypothetical protein
VLIAKEYLLARTCPYKWLTVRRSTIDFFDMKYNPDLHHRHSIRSRGYDRSQSVAYFITICTHECACILGKIIAGKMMVFEAATHTRL